ncbi:enoyl-CoA hydratase-related protein [Kibdelosporangium philippinense]|uniref:Enoyl-CoA hydratase-related protein n=1 Tax=Kibdelosporangium philippinense TaxID=211113 RepID=A0ABS8Z477_9PSEU|nr:enoyl-CoA hydratase-related protein [Kibdelosporangium philippinense]MCE7002714.1 enoyl-CoA hydratase-related protein [Kibdelosporangium philippinense]
MGTKRAAYYLYTSGQIDAATALELGLVNEVLPTDELLPRAWQIAEMIMTKPRAARRLTHAIVQRPWKRRLVQDFGFGLTHEMFGISADKRFG